MKKNLILIASLLFSVPIFAQADSTESTDTVNFESRYAEDPEMADTVVEKEEYVLEVFQVQQKAEFKKGGYPGLSKFLGKNIKYSPLAIEQGIEGTVYVQFVVEKDGSVSNLEIKSPKKLGFGCEEEAIRVVKLTSGLWEPAQQRGKPVRMRFRLPIKYNLY